jgi:SHOCT-like domain
MSQQTFPTSLAPEVFIETIQGNLQVKGWDRPEVSVKAQPDDLNLEEQEDVLHLSCQGDCTIRLPSGAAVRVGRVQGEARFKFLDDVLQIDQVAGNLTLRNLAEVHAKSVNGSLNARNIAGDLSAERIAGDASARNIQGRCHLLKVDGNVDLRGVDDSLEASCSGNLRLRLYTLDGERYSLEASGNLNAEIPANANADIKLHSAGESIRLRLAGQIQNLNTSSHELTLGGGGAEMQLDAGGSISLETGLSGGFARDEDSDVDEDFGNLVDLSAQISQQVEAQMQAVTRQINEQLANLTASMNQIGFSEEQRQQILEQARRGSERAAERAQEQARRAQEKLERKLEAARRRSEMKGRHAERRSRRVFNIEIGDQPAESVAEPVSDEERLMILRMLEQKKISLAEAEELLDALEGKS